MSFFSFDIIVAAANFLYSLGMLLEFAAFVWLRVKQPGLTRPYRVPPHLPAALVLCLVPSAFLVFVMAIAWWKVYAISATFMAAYAGSCSLLFFLFLSVSRWHSLCVRLSAFSVFSLSFLLLLIR